MKKLTHKYRVLREGEAICRTHNIFPKDIFTKGESYAYQVLLMEVESKKQCLHVLVFSDSSKIVGKPYTLKNFKKFFSA